MSLFQIDEQADIRIYTEDVNHLTWENIVKNRAQLLDLLAKLKENELYEDNVKLITERNTIFQTLKQEKVEVFNTDCKCEICGTKMGSKFVLIS